MKRVCDVRVSQSRNDFVTSISTQTTTIKAYYLLEYLVSQLSHIRKKSIYGKVEWPVILDHILITYPNLGLEFYSSSHWQTEHGPTPSYVLADLYACLEGHSGFTHVRSNT